MSFTPLHFKWFLICNPLSCRWPTRRCVWPCLVCWSIYWHWHFISVLCKWHPFRCFGESGYKCADQIIQVSLGLIRSGISSCVKMVFCWVFCCRKKREVKTHITLLWQDFKWNTAAQCSDPATLQAFWTGCWESCWWPKGLKHGVSGMTWTFTLK